MARIEHNALSTTGRAHRKCVGPDAIGLDIRVRGRDEPAEARMQLYQLTPAG